MSVLPSAVAAALLDLAKITGRFEVCRVGEFKSAPPQGLSFALWFTQIGSAVQGSGLDSTTAMIPMRARIHLPMLSKPEDAVEGKVADAADLYLGQLHGNFTLGGLVRNLDLLAEQGQPMLFEFGYLQVDTTLYRVADLALVAVLNDQWPQAE